jgi:hypothetical protein
MRQGCSGEGWHQPSTINLIARLDRREQRQNGEEKRWEGVSWLVRGFFFSSLLRDPISSGGCLGCLGSRPAANGFVAAIGDLRLIGALPQRQLIEPGPMDARGFCFRAHSKWTHQKETAARRWSGNGGREDNISGAHLLPFVVEACKCNLSVWHSPHVSPQ